jgi:hypothetical protein
MRPNSKNSNTALVCHSGRSQRHPVTSKAKEAYIPTIVLAAALALSVAAHAICSLSSVQLDAGLVKVGDSDRRVLESEPDRVVQLENRRGGAAGIRNDFYLRGQTVQVTVRAAQITRVCRLRN